MKRVVCAAFFVLLSTFTFAQDSDLWNWYFVGISSRSPQTEVIVRKGTARLAFNHAELRITFSEPEMPELKAAYVGANRDGKITGNLTGFFYHGTEVWGGDYHQLEVPKGCKWQEIMLKSAVADGAVLMLSRVQGKCQ